MDDKTRKFTCVICNYYCSRNAHLKNHLSSKKHIKNSQPNNIKDNDFKFECKCCGKKYKGQSGLWHHKKKCIPVKLAEVSEVGNEVLIIESTNSEMFLNELKKLTGLIETLSSDVNSMQIAPINVNNNTITNNTNFCLNVFLNETCKNAINLDSFIKNLIFEMVDPKLMIGNYVDGTCSILQKNLNGLPLNKRPLHCMEGEDPNQQLMHIRQDDKWNVGTYVNWLEQIHADDDDDVVDKNPIYYALKKIDDEKLKYLGYNYNNDDEYKIQHGRLNRETSRQDLKKEVYTKLLKIITIDPDILLSQ